MDQPTLPDHDLDPGDLVRVTFDPPCDDAEHGPIREATGTILRVAGLVYLQASSHRTAWRMPAILDLNRTTRRIERLDTAAAQRARQAAARRGAIVFAGPGTTAPALLSQLDELAGLMLGAEIAGETARRDELRHQFDDLADCVALAKRKRTYLLHRARIDDFHPWLTRDPRVMRIETVRPLPADFEPDPGARHDRQRRLEEAIRIFGEAERETRRLASVFRAAGYHVRRPHPNAQELLLRIEMSSSMQADIRLACSANGLWSAEAAPAENKRKIRANARLLRDGHLELAARRLARSVDG
ncbi:hypothetical protein [uncultured Jannaschia sp.]|uniref:hypothetical protein n=1 Tax=uncultured Jannaschia sp. TaxID=293347 RepID=UPI0026141CEE|nr:hypothetical protein [uncultured Jannaschia sp.]